MDHIGNLLDRPRLYRNIDGLAELGGSVLCLGFALLLWLLTYSRADSVWHRTSWFIFGGLLLLIHYGTKVVKARVTYPRTGFVEYRKPIRMQAAAAALGALTTIGLAIGFRQHWGLPALGSLAGLAFAAVCGYHFAGAVRWKWIIVGAMAVSSLVIAFLPADVFATPGSDLSEASGRGRLGGIILLSLMADGILLLISGGISFWLYLSHTEPPAQEGQ